MVICIEKGLEEFNERSSNGLSVLHPFPSIRFEMVDSITVSSANGGGMEEFSVTVTKLDVVVMGLLLPISFFGKEELLYLVLEG